MADPLWHFVGEHSEAYLELLADGQLELSANDVMVTAEGSAVTITTEAAVELRNALTDWLYKTTGHGWLERG